jgi:AAA+ ATPase superfamily predicted ATPase
MEKVFSDKSSPLFWRTTAKIFLDEFDINILKEILQDYNFYSEQNLLDIYTLFWGVPKYLEIFDELQKCWNLLENILKNYYVSKNSLFLNEWKDLLVTEFWKSYSTFFSILEAIANWKNKRSEIANYTKINYDSLWLYLEKLEKTYLYIEKINSIVWWKNKLNRYKIRDNFLNFWFRFIYKNFNLIEIWKYEELTKYILENIVNFQWFVFEKLMKQIIIKQNIEKKFIINFDYIWNYFDRTW